MRSVLVLAGSLAEFHHWIRACHDEGQFVGEAIFVTDTTTYRYPSRAEHVRGLSIDEIVYLPGFARRREQSPQAAQEVDAIVEIAEYLQRS